MCGGYNILLISSQSNICDKARDSEIILFDVFDILQHKVVHRISNLRSHWVNFFLRLRNELVRDFIELFELVPLF